MKKQLVALLSVFLFTVTAFAVDKLPVPKTSLQPVDQIVAIVNHQIITQSQVDQAYQRVLKQVREQGTHMPSASTLKREILNQLVYQKLQLQLAKRNNMAVSNAQVTQAIKRIAQQNKLSVAAMKQKIEAQGLPYAKYREQIKMQILISTLQHRALEKDMRVKKAEIDEFIEKYKSQKEFAMQYHLIDILVPLPSAPTATQARQAKVEATEIIKSLRRGTRVNAIKGAEVNDLDWRTMADLPTLFTHKLSAMKEGQVVGPLRAKNGYHLIKLIGTKKSSARLPSREKIKRLLQEQKFQKALQKWLLNLHNRSYVKIVKPQ